MVVQPSMVAKTRSRSLAPPGSTSSSRARAWRSRARAACHWRFVQPCLRTAQFHHARGPLTRRTHLVIVALHGACRGGQALRLREVDWGTPHFGRFAATWLCHSLISLNQALERKQYPTYFTYSGAKEKIKKKKFFFFSSSW